MSTLMQKNEFRCEKRRKRKANGLNPDGLTEEQILERQRQLFENANYELAD